ncbi:MAG: beta-L-arabinofuranosidase domain-containing protein [Spirochaetia bacterium]
MTGQKTRAKIEAKIDGGFWRDYQSLVREKVIPYQWKAMNDEIPGAPKSHSVENFRIAAGLAHGTYDGMVFQDSDLSKWLEAAGYVLGQGLAGDEALRAWAEEAIDLIARAQQPDGYVNTYFTVKEPGRRWKNLREAHELYCSGHLIEAGVAMHRGTGNQKILEIVRRLADLIDGRFGVEKGKIRGYPGHEEVELALVKLYRLTGERRYLERARYFIDERGRAPNFFDKEAAAPDFATIYGLKPLDYHQAHVPVREQTDAVGHAVRAMYLYTAMADLVLEEGDGTLLAACDRLWESTTGRRMYMTGGVGSSAHLESFSTDFDLPNDTAYAETCAAIGLFFFASRMARIHNHGRYADVMERALYNGIISGLALDGESYFYVNPLEVVPDVCDANGTYRRVKYRRQPWYGCACCPPNIARTLASLGEYLYHLNGDTLYVDLYHEGVCTFGEGEREVTLRQRTRYPWTKSIEFELETDAGELTLALRIPSWCRQATVRLNGESAEPAAPQDGYARIRRAWKKGDRLELTLQMNVERIHADPRVRADYGKVAIQRGPLVYCLEEVDNGPDLYTVSLPADAKLETMNRPDLLGGVVAISGQGKARRASRQAGALYESKVLEDSIEQRRLLFIPYYAWANRAAGEMILWVGE